MINEYKKNKVNIGKNSILILIISIISVFAIGTFAWFTWKSNETALVLTVGDISGLNVTLSPYKFNSSITPSSSYTSNDYVQVNAVDSSSSRSYTINLFYKINSIASELINSGFKYTVLRSTDGSSYSSYKSGNFSSASSGSDFIIMSGESLPSNTTYYYRVYIWIDSSSGNQTSMQGKVFDAELRADYQLEGVSKPILDDGMIPVTILNDGAVFTSSEDSKAWYNYGSKQWANAVLVDDDNMTSALDYSENRNDAVVNGATNNGTGLSFDGSNDYVTLSSLNTSFPVSYSVKFMTNSTSNQIIFGDYNTKIALGIYDSGNGFIMSLGGNTSKVINTGGLTTGVYYTVDIVANSLSDMKVYLNGTLLSARTTSNNWTWDGTNSYLGRRSSGTYFNGIIKKFIVYDDILTVDEIKHNLNVNNYAMCNDGIICSDLNLYYNFEGGMREYYRNAGSGIEVSNDDILAYYVWIPKYSYKINGKQESISISFDVNKSGYTPHPAFTFGGKSIDGFWASKFETSHGTTNNVGTSNPTILPNIESWRNITISQMFKTSLKFAGGTLTGGVTSFTGGNTYGLTNLADSHMMKSSEWGAVAYLSHSLYGINKEIRINNNSNFMTGCGADVDNDTLTSSCEIKYGGASSYPQSTTGNISGIFDMSGGSWEYVMAVFANANGKPYSGKSTSCNSGFNGIIYDGGNNLSYTNGIAFPESKYYELYMGTDVATACNSGVCYGHALSETKGWYSDYADLVDLQNPWVIRGGRFHYGSSTGVFYFGNGEGCQSINGSWRSVLITS